MAFSLVGIVLPVATILLVVVVTAVAISLRNK